MRKFALFACMCLCAAGSYAQCPTSVSDHEGNVYKTVQIGSQCWTAENMRCKTSPTGKKWQHQPATETYTPFYAHKTGTVNGWNYNEYYYNWAAAIDYMPAANERFDYQPSYPCRGICPQGWHIPSDEGWTELANYASIYYSCDASPIGSVNANAKALVSQMGWSPSSGPCDPGNYPSLNNDTRFGAVPAGLYKSKEGEYEGHGKEACHWSSTQSDCGSVGGGPCIFNGFFTDVLMFGHPKDNAVSVRCVKEITEDDVNPIVSRLSREDIAAGTKPEAVAYNYIIAILHRDFNAMTRMQSEQTAEWYNEWLAEHKLTPEKAFNRVFGKEGTKLDILSWNEVVGKGWEIVPLFVQDEGDGFFKIYMHCVPSEEVGIARFQNITRYNGANPKVVVTKEAGEWKVLGFK